MVHGLITVGCGEKIAITRIGDVWVRQFISQHIHSSIVR